MIDYLNIGPTPVEEASAQVGIDPNYESVSRRECAVFMRMLERLFSAPEGCNAYFVIKAFPHEFGTYREVCVRHDTNNATECEFAYKVEAASPAHWDAIARSELDWYEQRARYHAKVEAGDLRADQVPVAFQARHPPQQDNTDLPPLGKYAYTMRMVSQKGT